ncbi:MAG: hypothetical protein IKM17_00480, partial [Lentisphaeria bacterium]|nr:hypothetical protein [Lentisphaeria bacterium]
VADDFHTSAAQCREQQKQNAVDHKLSATPYFCDNKKIKLFEKSQLKVHFTPTQKRSNMNN